jgi:hypothetical protein
VALVYYPFVYTNMHSTCRAEWRPGTAGEIAVQ